MCVCACAPLLRILSDMGRHGIALSKIFGLRFQRTTQKMRRMRRSVKMLAANEVLEVVAHELLKSLRTSSEFGSEGIAILEEERARGTGPESMSQCSMDAMHSTMMEISEAVDESVEANLKKVKDAGDAAANASRHWQDLCEVDRWAIIYQRGEDLPRAPKPEPEPESERRPVRLTRRRL